MRVSRAFVAMTVGVLLATTGAATAAHGSVSDLDPASPLVNLEPGDPSTGTLPFADVETDGHRVRAEVATPERGPVATVAVDPDDPWDPVVVTLDREIAGDSDVRTRVDCLHACSSTTHDAIVSGALDQLTVCLVGADAAILCHVLEPGGAVEPPGDAPPPGVGGTTDAPTGTGVGADLPGPDGDAAPRGERTSGDLTCLVASACPARVAVVGVATEAGQVAGSASSDGLQDDPTGCTVRYGSEGDGDGHRQRFQEDCSRPAFRTACAAATRTCRVEGGDLASCTTGTDDEATWCLYATCTLTRDGPVCGGALRRGPAGRDDGAPLEDEAGRRSATSLRAVGDRPGGTGDGPPPGQAGTVPSVGSAVPATPADPLAVLAVLGLASLALAAWVLHRRLRREDALDNDLRSAILAHARDRPGASPTDVAEALDVALNTVLYHARILEELDYLTVDRSGRPNRLFADGAQDRRLRDLLTMLRRPGKGDVLRAVRDRPGIRLADLARRLDRDPSTVQRHADALVEAGMLVEERDGGARRFAVADRVEAADVWDRVET